MRKLASIQEILEIEEIPGALNVVKAKILGWEVVVKRNEFNVGDLCVFFETDSLLPKENPVFSFMESCKYRVKTVKRVGQISQGLAMPISAFPNLSPADCVEDKDLTDFLGITKYEKEDVDPEIVVSEKKNNKMLKLLLKYKIMRKIILPFISKEKGGFPSHIISRSDETRIQCMPEILSKEAETVFIATEKLEGSSATFSARRRGWFGIDFKVCSRNLELTTRSSNAWWQAYDDNCVQEYLSGIMSLFGRRLKSLAIQGEIIGPKLNNNIYDLKQVTLRVYRVKANYTDGAVKFYNPLEMTELFDVVQREFDIPKKLKVVPVIWSGKLSSFCDVNSVLDFADGFSTLKLDQLREGLVFSSEQNPEVSFKAVSRKYLLWKDKKNNG